MVLTGQVQREVVGLINAARAVRRRALRRGRPPVHRRAPAAVVDGEQVDIGLVGDDRPGRRRLRPRPARRRPDPGRLQRRAAARRRGLQRQRRHRRRGARGRARRREAGRPHRRRGPLRRLAGDSDEVIGQLTADELEELLPSLSSGMIPKMEACLRAVRGGVPQAHVLDGRVPHALLLEVFTARGRRDDGGPMSASNDLAAALASAALMNTYGTPAAGPRPRRGRQVWDADGTRYLDLRRRHRRQLARPRAPGCRRGGDRAGRDARAHVQPLVHAPEVELAERLLALLGRRRPGVLHQQRRRGERGGVQDGPPPRRPPAALSSPPRAPSTAARSARSR